MVCPCLRLPLPSLSSASDLTCSSSLTPPPCSLALPRSLIQRLAWRLSASTASLSLIVDHRSKQGEGEPPIVNQILISCFVKTHILKSIFVLRLLILGLAGC
ncbi:hypothetical protein COCNU_05G010620 [Cocos nucifera]|uniref:Uncharacterized protein n=1 Tax=Cocos nucifera TaxID=13894 RepID=A0A8K0I9E6_COCNU|nr:hypothetical protein COCNU_05G010620 [Cocos nucifera]